MMEFCPDFERIKDRYLQYWAGENHDLPLITVKAPKTKKVAQPPVSGHSSQRERWMDTAYNLEKWNCDLRNAFFGGEALPPEGMLYNIRAKSEEQARNLLKMAETYRGKGGGK